MADIKFNNKARGTPALIDGIPYQVGTTAAGLVKTVDLTTLQSAMGVATMPLNEIVINSVDDLTPYLD